jgi:FkbM family methyltransferase
VVPDEYGIMAVFRALVESPEFAAGQEIAFSIDQPLSSGLLKAPPRLDETPDGSLHLSAPDLVQSLYRRLLGREAQPAELESFTRKFIQEKNIDGVLAELLSSVEYRSINSARSPGPVYPIYLGNHQSLTRTAYGQRMFVDTRDMSVAPHLLLDGRWEGWVTEEFLRHAKEGAVIVEVGANIGYYTLLGASRVGSGGKMIAFEATPDLCELVFKSIEINGFLDRCEIINKVAMDREDEVPFRRLKNRMGGSSIVPFDSDHLKQVYESSDEILVKSVSLDAFLEGRGLPQVDLIKIDAEGSEPLIFKGLERTLKRSGSIVVIFELNRQMSWSLGCDALGMLQGFAEAGFTLHRIEPHGLVPFEPLNEAASWSVCEILMRKQVQS